MVNIRLFYYFFKKENLFGLLFFLSIASLLFIADIAFLFYLTRLAGVYLAFFFFFTFSAVGQVSIFRIFSLLLDQIRDTREKSESCMEHYLAYAGTLPTLLYMVYPGIISTLVGYVLLIAPIRKKLGQIISNYFKIDWDEVHEYLFFVL